MTDETAPARPSVFGPIAAAGYERSMGRWSRRLAPLFLDFVGEGGSTKEGLRMTRRAGDYHVVGYGENIDVPTIDLISTEVNVIGNLVGSYNDLVDLMALAAEGRVSLHTQKYALDDFQSAIDDLDAGRVRGRAILVP